MNDTPYVKSAMLGPEVIATMTAVSSAVRSIFPQQKPVGVQILAGGNCEALAVAKGNYPILIFCHIYILYQSCCTKLIIVSRYLIFQLLNFSSYVQKTLYSHMLRMKG